MEEISEYNVEHVVIMGIDTNSKNIHFLILNIK